MLSPAERISVERELDRLYGAGTSSAGVEQEADGSSSADDLSAEEREQLRRERPDLYRTIYGE